MKRRGFLQAATGLTSAAAITKVVQAQDDKPVPPPGFANHIVAIGRGVFSEAKIHSARNAQTSKVAGTMVCLTAAPPQDQAIYITLFAQQRPNADVKWSPMRCKDGYRKWYDFDGALRDIVTGAQYGDKITFFIPDAAHELPRNQVVDIRYVIAFWDLRNNLMPSLPHVALPHESVTPQDEAGFVAFGRGDERPPLELFNVLTRKMVTPE